MMTVREMLGSDVFLLRGPNRGIMAGVWWNVALLALSVAALPFDHRVILGLNPWIKPIKFELSVIVFLLTIAVLLSALCRRTPWPRAGSIVSWGIGLSMIGENSLIAMQSLRGVRSHMNYATPLDAAIFGGMGLFILANTILVAVLLTMYLVSHTGMPRALTLGIVLGLISLLAGSAEGLLMIVKFGAHTVGAADGGSGRGFVNWSTAHGDLRVAHFFALHAFQLFSIAGFGFSRTRLPERAQIALTLAFAVGYSAMVWTLFTDAVAGRPFLG